MGEHPDQRQILVDQPELIAPAVEEFLRYVSPVTHMCRTALDDVEVRGQPIKKGDYLCLLYPAANRDEDVWERAESSTSPGSPIPRTSRSGSPSTSASDPTWPVARPAS